MYYDKQIRYIDYLENGERQRNCGYVKITVTDNHLLFEMRIKGLYETDDVASEVVLEGTGIERRIGAVLIRQGSGSFRWELKDPVHVGEALVIGEGLCYGQLEQVHVQLSPRRSLRCVWREAAPKPQASRQRQDSGIQDVGLGTPGHKYEDRLQSGAGIQVTEREEKKTEDSGDLGSGIIQSVSETMAKAGEARGSNLRAAALETMAEEEKSVAEKGNKRTAVGGAVPEEGERTVAERVVTERGNERTGVGETVAEGEGERTAARGSVTEGEGERTVTERVVAERGNERTAVGETVTEGDGGRAVAGRAVAGGAVAERDAAEGKEMDRTAMESSTTKEADSTGNKKRNPAGEKAQGGRTGIVLEGDQALQPPQMASMSEDKWQQLWKIYPHIRPFQDEREYLSLRPEDFVILHSSAYRLVQNSFLLHGYFNYDHLILTQVSQRNGNQYYIGVPGNFYEKEKQVAIMYGFGSFECRREPAQEGAFGYYMIKVDL